MMMEILKELLLNAVISVLFALFLAHLVSFTTNIHSAGDDAAVAEEVSVVEKNRDDGKLVVVEEIGGGERGSEELSVEKPVEKEELQEGERGSEESAVEKPVEKEELQEGGDGCEEEGSGEVKDGNLEMEDGILEARKLEEEEGCFDVEEEEIGVIGNFVNKQSGKEATWNSWQMTNITVSSPPLTTALLPPPVSPPSPSLPPPPLLHP